jgi:hypothetical protein
MKQALFILLFFSFFSATGQRMIKRSPAAYQQLWVGITVSPDYNNRSLRSDGSMSADIVKESRDKREMGQIGYTAGLAVNYTPAGQWSIEAGVQYAQKGYRSKKENLVWPQPSPAFPTTSKFIYNYFFLDIPLQVKYTTGTGNCRFFCSAGLAFNIFLEGEATGIFEYANGSKDKSTGPATSNENKISLSPLLSAGIDYSFKPRMHFRLAPIFRYGITKMIDAPVSERLWNAGLNFGFYYRLL